MHQCMGGKGANQAVAAARLGAKVTFVACVGSDAFGHAAVEQYRAEGIDTAFVRQVAHTTTGTAAIVVDDAAENCIIVVPGANASLDTDDVRRASDVIAQADAVVCQLETPVTVTHEAFRIARSAGVRTVLTPAPVVELSDELLGLCDLCVPNRTEIERLVGCRVADVHGARLAARRLLDRGVGSVALTMGSDGALIMDQSDWAHVPAQPVQAVDTTGAGDAFAAALSLALCEGHSLRAAAEFARRVSAISVTRLGTQTSFPRRNEIEP